MKRQMRMMKWMVAVFAMQVLGGSFLAAQEEDQITVEWIYSPASRKPTALPRFVWLENGKALMVDPQIADSMRTFELYNPKNGKRTPVLDAEKARGAMQVVFGGEEAPVSVRWPLEFDRRGERALYVLKGDVYLLELQDARLLQVTKTEAKEKSAHFSPDGSKLAYVRDNDLYAYDIAQKTEQRLTDDGSKTLLNGTLSWVYWEEIFGRRDIGYWWSEDSKAIAYLQTDESNVDLMHYVDFKPNVPRVITQRYPKTGDENPKVRVGIVELNSGKTTWVNLPDYEYIARVQWLPGSQQVSVQTLNRMQTELDLYLANRATGESRAILAETDTAWVNINDDLYFLKDGKHFIWQSERDGYAHLYRYTLDGQLVNQITKGDWAVRSAGGGVFWLRRAVVHIDEKKGWIYFTALKKSSVEKQLYRIKMDGSRLTRLSREDGTHSITFSPDGKYYFDRYSAISTPPMLYLHKSDGKRVRMVGESRPEMLAKYHIQYPELFTIPARDGFPMPAQILKPADFDPAKKYPVIIYVYGGPSAPSVANAWQFANYFDQILLRNGNLVLRVDNRAATAISKKLENLLNRQMSGEVEMNDLLDAVQWLKSQPYVAADRIGIWGWSGGGTYTLSALTRSQEFKAGIAVAAVTDWHYYDTKWAEAAMKRPEDNPEGYEKTSLVKRAKNLHGRLLLVHGTYDDNVHPQNVWAFINELIRANKRYELLIYPMRKHGIADPPARIHLFNSMLDFWQRNL